MFPDARIIHTVRSERDTILSVYFLPADPAIAYATDLGDIAHYQSEQKRLMDHWRSLYPDDIFELDYDQLVAKPRPTIERMLEFCGLPWQDQVMDASRSTAAIRTASNWQVRQPISRGSSGRWERYRKHLGPLRGDATS